MFEPLKPAANYKNIMPYLMFPDHVEGFGEPVIRFIQF